MKHTRLIAISLAIVISLFTACNNSLTGAATVKGEGITAGNPLNINISTNENLKIFKTENTSRTITTDAFEADNTDLKFYLWGTSTSGDTLDPKLVDVSSADGITGTVILDIEALNWDLTLAVVDNDATLEGPGKEDAIKDVAVLIGYANVDMQFTNSINFTLSPKGLKKTGTIGLKLVRDNDWPIPAGYKVTAGLYSTVDMAEISSDYTELLVDSDHANDFFIGVADYADNLDANYTAGHNEIDPGTYVFEIRLTNDNDNRKYVWNDTLIVLPGKETNKTIVTADTLSEEIIIPNLIGTKPVSPKDFKVTYNEDDDTVASDWYTAHFSWNGDDVYTEKNFVIKLAELSDDQETPDAVDASNWEDLWEHAANTFVFDYNAMNNATDPETNKPNPNYVAYYDRKVAGSILANNTSIDLLLELGKRYIACMYSENDAGYSDMDSTDPSIAPEELAAYMNIQNDSNECAYTVINRFRVTYHTQSNTASWETSATPNLIATKVYHWGHSDKAYDVIAPRGTGSTPNAGTEENPWLHDGAADWLYWIEDPQTQVKYSYAPDNQYEPDDYEGYKNLDLYAEYSRNSNIIIYDDNDYDILPGWVEGFGFSKGAISKTSTNEFSKADGDDETINEKTVKTTTVKVTIPTVPAGEELDPTKNWIYDKVLFQITYGGKTYVSQEQIGAERGQTNEFKINLKTLDAGRIYNCKITAHYKRTVVSYPFTVLLKD